MVGEDEDDDAKFEDAEDTEEAIEFEDLHKELEEIIEKTKKFFLPLFYP